MDEKPKGDLRTCHPDDNGGGETCPRKPRHGEQKQPAHGNGHWIADSGNHERGKRRREKLTQVTREQ
jgi:hypothetical protein